MVEDWRLSGCLEEFLMFLKWLWKKECGGLRRSCVFDVW